MPLFLGLFGLSEAYCLTSHMLKFVVLSGGQLLPLSYTCIEPRVQPYGLDGQQPRSLCILHAHLPVDSLTLFQSPHPRLYLLLSRTITSLKKAAGIHYSYKLEESQE